MTARTRGRASDTARLVKSVATGDRAAFEQLYRCTAGSVHALIRRVLPDETTSAEVTEEVYVRVWSSAHAYDHAHQTAESWLLGLAHRCAVERIRADRRSPVQASVLPELAGPSASRAVELLTPEQAEALELAYLGGRTHAESAKALGVDQATFRLRVSTALSRLRQSLHSGGSTVRRRSDDVTR